MSEEETPVMDAIKKKILLFRKAFNVEPNALLISRHALDSLNAEAPESVGSSKIFGIRITTCLNYGWKVVLDW